MLASSTPAPSSLTGGAPSGSSLDPESEELKKTYLSLLPSVQIIEICLTLESHVPSHVRKGIWPADLQAAIYALRQTSAGNASHSDVNPSLAEDTAPTTQHVLADTLLQTPEQSTAPSLQGSKDESPPMRSLWDGMSENRMSSTPAAQDISTPGPAAAIQPQQQVPATQDAAPSAVPPAQPPPSSMIHPPSPKPSTPTASTSTAHAPANGQQASLQPLDPQSSSTTRTSTPQTQPPVPYPYAPYGYPLQPQPQQASYPHAPYFPPPPSHGYPSHYPYPGYPPPPGYPSPPPPPPTASGHAPSHPPHPASSANGHGHSLFTSTPLVRSSHPHASPHPHHHPHAPHPGMPGASGSVQSPPHPPPHSHPHPHAHAEDLPSYEDMIVEALLDTADPEGAAPKDLFAWMALRYPLQTNFRPSASQALQKAFKRGRLEKTPSGKYRLNPTWEGGATTKRTTRRPQTLAQTTHSLPPPPPQHSSSPFTHAPLPAHPHHPQHPQYPPPPNGATTPGQPPPYPGYMYGYPPVGYPGYPYTQPYATSTSTAQQPAQDKSTTAASTSIMATPSSTATTAASAGQAKSGGEKDESAEGLDAWEAAQHILRAINFGSLDLQSSVVPAEQHAPTTAAAVASGSAQSQAAHPPPVIASSGFDYAAGPIAELAVAGPSSQRIALTDDERASLQAHLALLAAQLAEIGDMDEDEDDADEHEPENASTSVDLSIESAAEAVRRAVLAAAQFHSGHQIDEDMGGVSGPMPHVEADGAVTVDEDEDSDADMEMVEVPTFAGNDTLRT